MSLRYSVSASDFYNTSPSLPLEWFSSRHGIVLPLPCQKTLTQVNEAWHHTKFKLIHLFLSISLLISNHAILLSHSVIDDYSALQPYGKYSKYYPSSLHVLIRRQLLISKWRRVLYFNITFSAPQHWMSIQSTV